MQKAVPVGQGAMAAILNLPIEAVEIIAADSAQGQVCVVANDNSDGQVVISGHKGAIERAISLALERGAKRALPLPVSAPFHSPLMEPAAIAMAESLDLVNSTTPGCPILTNVTASLVSDDEILKRLLVEQVTGRVRWRESMTGLPLHGISHCIEVGAGKVLTGLVKRSAPNIEASALNTVEDMKILIDSINKELIA
jgi:[acyl-carrier-protein] S-malonyltransferase